MNAVYADLRLVQNLFLPSVKLHRKERVGARLRRYYDAPQTPLDRVRVCLQADAVQVAALVRQHAQRAACWARPGGALKARECREFLERLEAAGIHLGVPSEVPAPFPARAAAARAGDPRIVRRRERLRRLTRERAAAGRPLDVCAISRQAGSANPRGRVMEIT
jgi:hypothetical protein